MRACAQACVGADSFVPSHPLPPPSFYFQFAFTCSYEQMPLDCSNGTASVLEQVGRCIYWNNVRFDMALLEEPNIHTKCFDYKQTFSTYMDYMKPKLQPRRITAKYAFHANNKKRDKGAECIWKDPALVAAVKKHLLDTYDYYKFCDRCLGTANDITSPEFVEPVYSPLH